MVPAESLHYEVEITTNRSERQQGLWVSNRLMSPSLRHADRERLREPYFPVALGTGGTFYWRVRASRAEGLCAGPWSDWWSFTWTGPAEDLGSLGAPTCVAISGDTCPATETIAPTASRTPRPTATRAPTATPTLFGGPDITIIAFTPTSPPAATKTPVPPKPTDKPTDKTPEDLPTETSQK